MFGFPKYKIVFMKNTKDGYVEIARKTFNPKRQTLNFREGTFTTTISEISHHKGSTHFLYKDYDTGQSLAFDKGFLLLEPQDLKTMIATQLAKAAVNAGGSDYGLITLIAVGIGALMGGLFLMTILYPQLFPNMVRKTADMVVTLLG